MRIRINLLEKYAYFFKLNKNMNNFHFEELHKYGYERRPHIGRKGETDESRHGMVLRNSQRIGFTVACVKEMSNEWNIWKCLIAICHTMGK